MFFGVAYLWNWLGSTLWLIFIFVICSLPVSSFAGIKEKHDNFLIRLIISDPVGHSGMFVILGFLLGYGLHSTFAQWGLVKVTLGILLLGFVLGLTVELYQMLLVSGRSFELADLGWDMVGLLISAGAFLILKSCLMDKINR